MENIMFYVSALLVAQPWWEWKEGMNIVWVEQGSGGKNYKYETYKKGQTVEREVDGWFSYYNLNDTENIEKLLGILQMRLYIIYDHTTFAWIGRFNKHQKHPTSTSTSFGSLIAEMLIVAKNKGFRK